MKRIKAIYLLLGSTLLGGSALAQPSVSLRMSFNAPQNRYEVLATPNFSARNFTWGPSQVSVVLPASQTHNLLTVKSTVAGVWTDNSLVVAPAVAPIAQFHGITTSGGKVDLVAGEEFLLFDFSLPSGYVENVRLFHNGIDPNSAQAGMKGGDFRSYMSDETGSDYLAVESAPVSLSALKDETAGSKPDDELTQVQLVAYPNPVVGGKFRLFLKGFDPGETVTVRLHSLTGIDQKSLTDKVNILAGQAISVPTQASPYYILSLERLSNHQIFTQKIWMQD